MTTDGQPETQRLIRLTATNARHQAVDCFVNPAHVAAIRPAAKQSMDDPTESAVILAGGEELRVQESPRRVAELMREQS